MTQVKRFMGKKGTVAVAVIVILLLIVYTLIIFFMYNSNSGIFGIWDSDPPPNGVQPLIEINQLTADQQSARAQLMASSSGPTPN